MLKERIGGDVITLNGNDPQEIARIIVEKFQIRPKWLMARFACSGGAATSSCRN